MKSYLKQDNVASPPQHNNILFELDFNVKFPLLLLLQFQSDLKSSYYSLDHEIMMNEGMCARKDKVKEKVWDIMSIKTVHYSVH